MSDGLSYWVAVAAFASVCGNIALLFLWSVTVSRLSEIYDTVIEEGKLKIETNNNFIRSIKAQGSTLDLLIERLDNHDEILRHQREAIDLLSGRLDQQYDVLMSHKEGLTDHKVHIDDHSAAIQVMNGTDENLTMMITNIGDALVKLEQFVEPDESIFHIPPKH